jgi:hypothetical protein
MLLSAACTAPGQCDEAKGKKLLLIGQGPDGHPPGTHEFMAGLKVLRKCLEPVKGIEIETVKADEPWAEGPEKIAQADAIVMMVTQGARWMQSDPRRYDALTRLAARGGGMVALHWSVGAKDAQYIDGQLKLLGGTRGGPQRRYGVATRKIKFLQPEHPILRGVEPMDEVHDEFYYRLDLVKNQPGFHPLLQVMMEENEETIGWTWDRPDGGRSFGYVGFHFHDRWRDPSYRRLAAHATLWALKMDVPKDGLAVEVTEDDLQLPPARPKKAKQPKQ